jgi:hypothetical protein
MIYNPDIKIIHKFIVKFAIKSFAFANAAAKSIAGGNLLKKNLSYDLKKITKSN